jgi:ribosome-binding protein aMBF1 (putative translation factor)
LWSGRHEKLRGNLANTNYDWGGMANNVKKMLEVLGRNIRKARMSSNLSQEQLAEKAGLHRTYIGMVERGEKNITLGSYARISKALDVSIYELLDGADESAG